MIEISARVYASPAELHRAAKERRERFFPRSPPVVKPMALIRSARIIRNLNRFSVGEQADAHVRRRRESLSLRFKTAKLESVMLVCAFHFGITVQDLKSNRRTKDIVKPRQIAMFLARTQLDRSYPEIGRRFGGRDHTTVLHAQRKIAVLIKSSREVAEAVEAIVAELLNAGVLAW